jgi:NitT/TauT family transport system permease protein
MGPPVKPEDDKKDRKGRSQMTAQIAAAAPGRTRPRAAPWRKPWFVRLAALVVAVALWEIAVRQWGDPAFLSPPSRIVAALDQKILADPRIRDAIWLTFVELAVAFGLSVAIALPVGLVVGASAFAHRSFFPIILLAYAIPQVSILPLFVLIFGLGPASKVAFGVSHGIFPIIVNVIAGLRNVNPLFVNSARSMGATKLQIVRRVVLPCVVPSFFTGLRLAMTATLLGVLLAELYVSIAGIGYFTRAYAETFDPSPLFALIAVLAAMAVLLNETVRRAEARYSRWRG